MADRAQNATILNPTVKFCAASRRRELRVTYTNLCRLLGVKRTLLPLRPIADEKLNDLI